MLTLVTALAQEVRLKAKASASSQPILAKFALGVADSILGAEKKEEEVQNDCRDEAHAGYNDECSCHDEEDSYEDEDSWHDDEEDELDDEEGLSEDELEEVEKAVSTIREEVGIYDSVPADDLQVKTNHNDEELYVASQESLSDKKTFKGIKKPMVTAFKAFHAANPNVYSELYQIGHEVASSGAKHVSVRTLIEVAKYEALMNGKEIKVGNNHASLYARLLIANDSRFAELFRTRR